MDLSLERWEGSMPKERESIARQLAKQLPSGFEFRVVRLYQLGDQSHHVALFTKDGATFALIPGTFVFLGYDINRPWEPTPEELMDWQAFKEEYGTSTSLQELIANSTLRVRQVTLKPFLIETEAHELGWERISIEDNVVQDNLLINLLHHKETEITQKGLSTRISQTFDGEMIAERLHPNTHAGFAAGLGETGFRFPTSDEWEFACGAGAATLFRWGDHVPCDRSPYDISPIEAEWRLQQTFSFYKLKSPEGGFLTDWKLHRRPNAFGLTFPSDTYGCELMTEIGVRRGGDGGFAICGGLGFFLAWIALATAHCPTQAYNPYELISHKFYLGRRVLELE